MVKRLTKTKHSEILIKMVLAGSLQFSMVKKVVTKERYYKPFRQQCKRSQLISSTVLYTEPPQTAENNSTKSQNAWTTLASFPNRMCGHSGDEQLKRCRQVTRWTWSVSHLVRQVASS
uniref:Uncharacterized protein n=1 Tax=Anguilla anguilla TaxID=7936 RepID=A0A0E9WV35_ANGAN